jgi:diguanylate cyclase (GGDEF)-like protein
VTGAPTAIAPAPTERAPRLTLRFVASTALASTVAAGAVCTLVHHTLARQAETDAVARSRLVADAVLATSLRAADFSRPAHGARRARLDRLFRKVLAQGTVRASLYDTRGRVLYSTDGALIGTRTPVNAAWLEGLRSGKAVSAVRDSGKPFGSVLDSRIALSVGGKVVGSAGLERRYGPIASSAWRTSIEIAAVLEGLFLLLLVALAPAMTRASSRLRRQVAEIDHVATHDPLLGLLNRVGFQRAIARRRRRAATLIVVDLDGFHEVNDTLGAASGDRLLVEWCRRLLPALGDCELVARLGEDEIGILVCSPDRTAVDVLVRHIQESSCDPVDIDGVRLALEATVGIALLPGGGADVDRLLREAGVALAAAKSAHGRVAQYDEADDENDVAHLLRTAELRNALANGELTVFYQPQADLGTHVIRGVEALVRWRHPREGILEAGSFIESAERSGIIVELDRFVLECAAHQWREWKDLGFVLDIAVNLAPANLLDARLPEHVARVLASHQLPPEHLILEITELALVRDDHRTQEVLRRLRTLGVRLAIDDYGTGYSSLAYLRRLPIQQVKLDRTFIETLPGNRLDQAIVRSTTELAHTLGATVVVEGVENEEQWAICARHGCDIAQGFLISRALPEAMLTELLLASCDRTHGATAVAEQAALAG